MLQKEYYCSLLTSNGLQGLFLVKRYLVSNAKQILIQYSKVYYLKWIKNALLLSNKTYQLAK